MKRNIGAFRGDPARITVFGESAGGASVLFLMASPLAKGLSVRAIAENAPSLSLYGRLRDGRPGLEPAEKMGERAAQTLSADTPKRASVS